MTERSTSTASDSLADFRARLDIVAAAEELTEVSRRSGGTAAICCPFHGEKTPSCYLYADDNHFHCFGCGKHGDIFGLVAELRDCTFGEALDWLSELSGVPRPSRNPEVEAAAAALRRLRTAFAEGLAADPVPGISADDAARLGLGRARDLAALSAELPRRVLSEAELTAWEGALTVELHARGGHVGFGAFVAEGVERPARASATNEVVNTAFDHNTDIELADDEPYDDEAYDDEAYDDEAYEAASEPGANDDGDVEPIGSERSAQPEPASDIDQPFGGRFRIATGLRRPAFIGLPAARETINRQATVLVSPDPAEALRLALAGIPGVISPARSIDPEVADALVELAPRVVLLVSPERRRRPDFLDTPLALLAAGAEVALAAVRDDAVGSFVPLSSWIFGAAERLEPEARAGLLRRFYDAVPSRSSRELYRIAARERSLA